MKAYFAWLNARGGIHGRALSLYVKDDRYDPARTPDVVRTLVRTDRVFAVVGALGRAQGQVAAPLLARAGVPFFTPASGGSWFSSEAAPARLRTVYLPYAIEGRLLARAAVRRLGLGRVAVLHRPDVFADGLTGVRAELERLGRPLVAAEALEEDEDPKDDLSKILEADPDALVLYLDPSQAVRVGRALAPLEARPQLLTSFVLSAPSVITRAGPEVWEGTLTAMVGKLADDVDDPAVRLYRRILADHAPGLSPRGFAMSGVRFAQPFVEALERAGPDLDRVGWLRALDGLEDYRGGGPYWPGEGLGPPVDFGGSERLGVRSIRLARARDGRWVHETDWLSLEEVP